VIEDASVDAIYCDQYEGAISALQDWWRCIKVGGHLVLNIPGEGLDVTDAMRSAKGDLKVDGWDLIRRDDNEGVGLYVFRKRADGRFVHPWILYKRPKKTACVVRYGGFGDLLQASNVFPALKRQGYHVTVMTTPAGQDILKEDPHVDAWFIQDQDQVPNPELGMFWKAVSKRFDRFVNLCESVENSLLAMPGRASFYWPKELRHKRLNTNYLEFASDIAEVPYASELKFYPTPEETKKAKGRLLHGGTNIVFALSGSNVHKFYPHQDAVIARILLEVPNCRIFLCGDAACKILEEGWTNEPRIVCLSGEDSIRDTLALAKYADVVLGSETGVLNAVAFEDNRKVCLLSHSSHENLTKHWKNTAALAAKGLSCYPCHRLHHNRDHCPEDKETGASLCQKLIDPEEVFQAVIHKEEAAA
jgi:ADP-heptose:LPS heptosyltransferase